MLKTELTAIATETLQKQPVVLPSPTPQVPQISAGLNLELRNQRNMSCRFGTRLLKGPTFWGRFSAFGQREDRRKFT